MIMARTIGVGLMAAALVGASTVTAQAGAGGAGGFGDQVFFQCYSIEQGVNPTNVVEVNDQFTNPTGVKIGKAKMLCAPADGTPVSGPDLTVLPPFAGAHLVCYEVPDKAKADAVVTLTDPFGSQTVKVKSSKFVCVGAVKECVSGCPIIGGD